MDSKSQVYHCTVFGENLSTLGDNITKDSTILIQGFTLNHEDFTPFIGLNTKTIRVNTLIYALFVFAFHFTFASSFFSTLSCSLVLALMQCSQVQHHNPTIHPFDTNSSRSQQDNFQDDMCPADFVCFYLTDAVFHNMVTETNCYAHQLIAKKKANRMLKPKSCLPKRKPTDLKEMKKFIGTLIFTRLIKKGSYADY